MSKTVEELDFPENLYYTKEHEWLLVEDKTGTVGVTAYVSEKMPDILYFGIKQDEGEPYPKEEAFGELETVKATEEVYLPVSCTIIEFNEILEREPGIINNDPYGEGWMIKVEISDTSELESLMDANAYRTYCSELDG